MSALSCANVRADLSAYLDGELDAGLTDAIRAHLEGCASCRTELELLRLTLGALHRLPELPPPAAILSGVRARLQPEPWYRRLFGPWHFGFPLSAAATLLVVIGISLLVARFPDLPKTVSQGSPPSTPARRNLRAKGAPEATAPSQATSPDGAVASPESAAVAGAKEFDHFVPAAPAEPVIPSSPPAVESKLEQAQPAQEAPAAAAPKDAWRGEQLAAAPSGAVFDRKADSGSSVGYARVAAGKEKAMAATEFGVVCLLRPDGDTVSDLERLLRLEGAAVIEVRAFEPPALREAYAKHRGRLDKLSEPSQGWTMTARVQVSALPRLLEVLAGRTGLRILEVPAAPAAQDNPGGSIDLRVTVFR